jgi:biopolymer transport protein ExbD
MAMDVGAPSGKPGRATPSMNVTPLVDVVLVLLIIFMVITPLMAKQFWLYLPNKPNPEETPPDQPDEGPPPVVVLVTKTGEVKIGPEVIPLDQLAVRLKRKLAAATDQHTVFFDAEDEAPFGRSMQVMDVARKGGGVKIVVLTDAIAQR